MQTKVDIINALDTLDPEQLNKVAIYITDIRRASWAVEYHGDAPESTIIDEPDTSAELGPCATWTPDKPPAAFDGTQTTPIPLKQPVGDVAATKWVAGLNFRQLCSAADRYNVPYSKVGWSDDEWPGKEDELRVAVTEAMEKI